MACGIAGSTTETDGGAFETHVLDRQREPAGHSSAVAQVRTSALGAQPARPARPQATSATHLLGVGLLIEDALPRDGWYWVSADV